MKPRILIGSYVPENCDTKVCSFDKLDDCLFNFGEKLARDLISDETFQLRCLTIRNGITHTAGIGEVRVSKLTRKQRKQLIDVIKKEIESLDWRDYNKE